MSRADHSAAKLEGISASSALVMTSERRPWRHIIADVRIAVRRQVRLNMFRYIGTRTITQHSAQ
jgi:hypothetical protein